jgi:trans-2,3-dihydro-3-hydroxyanthranilate isomerase
MTSQYPYHLVDVFTDRAFGGNPLAVFIDGREIPEAMMQSIAREMNLSETTFVLPSEDSQNDFRVRIFTPAAELPMAGHPTIGTAFILARVRLVRQEGAQTTITFEEGVGPVPVTINWKENNPGFIEMRQSRPDFAAPFADVSEVAAMLSLAPETIRATNLPVQIVSCGVPYLLVPVSGLDAIRRVRFRMDLWEKLLCDFGSPDVLVFTTEVECAGSSVHSRMFAPAHGIAEDPATGSAAGPLGCYLVRHRVLPFTGELRCVSEQGIEMGRPSFLHVRIAEERGEITAVRVGGDCHYMGAGHLELELKR